MTRPVLSLGAAPDLSLLLSIGIPVTAMVLALSGWAVRRRHRPQKRLSSLAVKVAAVAALGSTAYSADTSWRFASDYLDMAGTAERIGMFAAAELGLFATALMARQNLATEGVPGLPGTLVWVITGVQVIPAYAESGPVGGTVRAFVGPVMAAVLWHLAMGIELRLRTPGAASRGLIATLGREARERLLSRLAIAARDRDAAQITRDRATARAVAIAARLAEYTPEQRRSRRGRRLTRRLSKAIGRASVGTDPDQRAELLAQLAARRHALALVTVPLPSPWSPRDGIGTTPVPASDTRTTTVPVSGPLPNTESSKDRGPRTGRGPGTVKGYTGTVTGTGDRPSWTEPGIRDCSSGTGDQCEATAASTGDRNPGTEGFEVVGHADPDGREWIPYPAIQAPEMRGRSEDIGSGNHPAGDRVPKNFEPRTDLVVNRGPNHADPGTDFHGNRGQAVPARGPSVPKATGRGKAGGSPRGPQAQRPSRGVEQSVERLVEQVRPHVPALLARDGNEAVTRVQLREILRREGLKGGRNDRLSLVLQQLRSEGNIMTTRSTR
ncbi:hypothetical protein [Streptomyces sp. NPDC003247]|uniref:hypothetical protein n=1 Tax=Streptomyces sp. NPDC003247 TaxID=3364677 RepID=UPI0036CC3D99